MSAPLTLYTRNPCPLCVDLVAELEDLGLEFARVDLDRDPRLLGLYGERVPVLLDQAGNLLVEGRLDGDGLRRLRQLKQEAGS